jgi:hypothetical protein
LFADLDETVRQLLIRQVPLDPAEIDISFDAPDRQWSGRLTRPAVNCFLYDVHENLKLRTTPWDVRHEAGNHSSVRQRVPHRVDVTYQITAWATAAEDEHRLLWRLLFVLAKFGTLPKDVLQGALQEQPLPIPTSIAQQDQMPMNYADLWQSLDNRIRPALTYVVTVAMDTEIEITTPVVLRPPEVKVLEASPAEQAAAIRDGLYPVRGRVRDRRDHTQPVAGALVVLRETGARTLTGDDGYFTIGPAPRGPITLIVLSVGREETTWPSQVPSPSFELEV